MSSVFQESSFPSGHDSLVIDPVAMNIVNRVAEGTTLGGELQFKGGVLLQGTGQGPDQSAVSVGGGVGRFGGRSASSVGVGVNISPTQTYASGIAVWVENPPPPGD